LSSKRGVVRILQEFSLPLIIGVFAALLAANLDPEGYQHLIHSKPIDAFLAIFGVGGGEGAGHAGGGLTLFGYELTLHWLVNDVFMVLFFGIAAKEITEACLPGGSLNPLKTAINPLIATMGGILGPVGVFFLTLMLLDKGGVFPEGTDLAGLQRGWGIPTATDIALAWLVARSVFGKGHPAINFLLLLAVADDAIGLAIIAIFYGDPMHPAEPKYLALVLLGMAVAYGMRRMKVSRWQPYIFIAGPIAWSGLILAHLHPALALVFIVPFLPGPKRDTGLFMDEDEVDISGAAGTGAVVHADHSALHLFEHQLKLFVDFGLFFFAFANAGVEFAEIGPMTWTVLTALVVGKTVGIGLFGYLGEKLGFPLPKGMTRHDLMMAGFVAALGLTVALFVAGEAFTDPGLQGQAKMGALASGLVGLIAVALGRMLGFGGGGRAEGTSSDEVVEEPPASPETPPGALPASESERVTVRN
jgi:NhaA family Na+:H+ antiporter